MKRLFIPITIFLCLLIFMYFANSSLINLCDYLIESSEEIEFLIEDKDYESCKNKIQEILTVLDDKTKITAVYINHADFDNFLEETNELYLYIKCEDYTNSLIAANSLKELAKNIEHLHEVTIENIF